MQFKTHITTSLVIATPILKGIDAFTISSISGVCIGSVFPDIDEPKSFIGRKTIFLSSLVKMIFGHRGITHSLFCIGILTLLCYLFFSPFLLGFTLGYFLHVFEDSFSVSGVCWWLPINHKVFKYKKPWITYKTGGAKEYFIFVSALTILVWQFRAYDYGNLVNEMIVLTEQGWSKITSISFKT